MKKLSNERMNEAFSEVEYMDFLIVAVLLSKPADTSDLWWEQHKDPYPTVAVNRDLNKWEKGLIMVLVGIRSNSSVAIRFRLKDDDSWECLVPKEERDEICRRSMAQAAAKAQIADYDRSGGVIA